MATLPNLRFANENGSARKTAFAEFNKSGLGHTFKIKPFGNIGDTTGASIGTYFCSNNVAQVADMAPGKADRNGLLFSIILPLLAPVRVQSRHRLGGGFRKHRG